MGSSDLKRGLANKKNEATSKSLAAS